MKSICLLLMLAFCMLMTFTLRAEGKDLSGTHVPADVKVSAAADGGWYFAVSGDSRDCGDVIMPKIARAIADRSHSAPVQFYWHLGDFRAIYRVDCDMIKRTDPVFQCPAKDKPPASYIQKQAWDDFIRYQLTPFGKTPVFLGIGNHELYGGLTRYQYREKFKKWLGQSSLEVQRRKDAKKGIVYQPGDSYYHFTKQGVDFISLDNADDGGFSEEQLQWLSKILAVDAQDESVKTLVIGMHAALPHSKSSGHAMDKTCPSLCSGERAYTMLHQAQNLDGPPEKQKHVYVFASHSHQFLEDIYNMEELKGKVLPGWIVGTAGAEQYTKTIRYGYLQAKVKSDGSIDTEYVEVTKDSPPTVSGKGAEETTSFCFEKNLRESSDKRATGCGCGTSP